MADSEPGVDDDTASPFAAALRRSDTFMPGIGVTAADTGIPTAAYPGVDDETFAPMAQPRDDRFQKIISGVEESGKRTERILEEREKALEPIRDDVRTAAANARVDIPELEKPLRRPNIRNDLTENAQQWMGLATVIAMIGAGRSRTAGTTGLQAMAGIFNGLREGNEDRVKREWAQFKAANEAIIANNRAMVEEYKLKLQDKKMDLDQKIAEMQIIASQYQDQVMMEALKQRNLVDVGKLIAGQANIANRAEQSMLRTEKLKADLELAKARSDKLKEEKQTTELGGLTEEDIKFFAEQENTGDHSWRLGFTGRTVQNAKARAAIMQRASQLAREQGRTGESQAHATAKFSGEMAASRTLQTRLENINAFAEVADSQFNNAIAASEKYKRYGWRAGNTAWQAWHNQTGSPELREFGAALQAAINAWARAINAGGQKTVHDTDVGEKLVTTTFNHEDVVSLMRQLHTEINLEKDALQRTLDSFTERHTTKGGRKSETPKDEGWITLPNGTRIRQLD